MLRALVLASVVTWASCGTGAALTRAWHEAAAEACRSCWSTCRAAPRHHRNTSFTTASDMRCGALSTGRVEVNMTLELPVGLEPDQISGAQLWTRPVKMSSSYLESCRLFSSTCQPHSRDLVHNHPLTPSFTATTTAKGGWVQSEMKSAVVDWIELGEFCRRLHFHCQHDSCPLFTAAPFLAVQYEVSAPVRRKKRYYDCVEGSTECCRKRLYISFEELGWDWVLQPPGYDAYYCSGHCSPSTAITSTRYLSLIQKVKQVRGGLDDIGTCCVPSEMGDVSVVRWNGTDAVVMTVADIVVKACGCQ